MELVLQNVKKSFDKKEVLKGITYTFKPGSIYGLLGRNGAGKTTMFNCINDDITPEEGTIQIREGDQSRDIKAEDIGYVLSTPEVPAFLTAREFLTFFTDINFNNIKDIRSADEYFDIVGIKPEDRDLLLKDYSHGMKTKMQMIINLIADTKILLLDEPLTSLDVVAAEEMKELLKEQKNDRILIFSTHIMELALNLCDEILILKDGKVTKFEMTDENGEPLPPEDIRSGIINALKDEDDL